MHRRVLIIPDKFKGTLTAEQAANAIATGWRACRPDDEVTCLPMTDGGDGFGAVMSSLMKATVQTVETVDAAHRPCIGKWWWVAESRIAIIESAAVIGLAQLPRGQFHPFQLDTFGLGAVLLAARELEPKAWLIGIGGSATNDGGFGLARALGWTFEDANGSPILKWTHLPKLARIRPPEHSAPVSASEGGDGSPLPGFSGVTVVADVRNPLLGASGASRVYGPQKGLRPRDMKFAERCLRSLARGVRGLYGMDLSRNPGMGAAGGLGFGLHAFLGARMEPGFDLFARYAKLDEVFRNADLVVTGEGSLDASSLMGKGVGQLATLARSLAIPCIGLAGHVAADVKRDGRFFSAIGLDSITDRESAMRQPAHWLTSAAQLAAQIPIPHPSSRP